MVVMTSNIWVHPKTKVYYFRREVPKDIREAIGKREWKVSLKTKNINEARLRHNAEAQKCEEAFAKARAHLSGTVRIFPSDAPILADRWALSVMQEWVNSPATLMNFVAVEPIPNGATYTDGSPCETGETYNSAYKFSQSIGADKANEKVILSEITETLANEGIPLPDTNDPSREALIYSFTVKYRELCILALDRLKNDWGKTISTDNAHLPLSISSSQDTKETTKLSFVYDKWAEDKLLNDGSNRSVLKTISEYETIINRFIDLHTDLSIDLIDRAIVQEFRESLAKIPSRCKEMKGKSARELIKLSEVNNLKTLSPQTIRKHLKVLSTVLNFARQRLGLIDIEPVTASGIIPRLSKATKKANAKMKRNKDYSLEDLRLIFSSPLFTGNWSPNKVEHKYALYWIPLLMAYSGARREEVCQLDVADITKDSQDDIWFFKIAPNNKDKVTKLDKSRDVPIHRDILSLGFLDYINSLDPNGKLFPSLKPHPTEGYGASFGKLWSRYLKDIVRLETTATPSHGFRHSFKTICTSIGIDPRITDAITGHAPEKTGDTYINVRLKMAAEAIDQFPSLINTLREDTAL